MILCIFFYQQMIVLDLVINFSKLYINRSIGIIRNNEFIKSKT